MSSHFSRLCSAVGDLLFPLRCVGCGCYDTLACARCIAVHLQPQQMAGPYTPCTPSDRDDTIQSIITLGPYADPFWRAVVAALKFHHQPRVLDGIGPTLGHVVNQLFPQEYNEGGAPQSQQTTVVTPSSCWYVPIPLHPRRERERGYNQSTLIAVALAQHTGATVAPHLLRRVVATESQTVQGVDATSVSADGVSAHDGSCVAGHCEASTVAHHDARALARQKNVAGTMALGTVPSDVNWSATHVLLVDDVVTTGATVHEAARALAALKPQRFDVVAIARGAP